MRLAVFMLLCHRFVLARRTRSLAVCDERYKADILLVVRIRMTRWRDAVSCAGDLRRPQARGGVFATRAAAAGMTIRASMSGTGGYSRARARQAAPGWESRMWVLDGKILLRRTCEFAGELGARSKFGSAGTHRETHSAEVSLLAAGRFHGKTMAIIKLPGCWRRRH